MNRLHTTLLCTLLAASLPTLAEVTAEGAWIRGMVAKQTATGAFMTLRSTQPVELVGASSPVAGVAAVHEVVMESGVMKMRALPALDIPANTPVELKPGSYHIMLMALKRPLQAGELVPVTLTFTNHARHGRETLEVQAEVRLLTAPTPPQH